MLLNAKSIKEAVFATSMSGYKKDEVDALLDKILADYLLLGTPFFKLHNLVLLS